MTTLATAPASTPTPARRTGPLLAVLLLGQFMAVLDVQVVNVAAPTIRTDLHASGAGLQLVIAGYTISYAMLLITGARLGDRLGHRRLFLAGLAGFTAASLACGLAGSTGLLIGFRFVQGAAAALMMPQVLSLIQRHFNAAARARALGYYAAVIASAAIIGQVVGGLLVGADLWGTGWRPVFLVNIPIGITLLVIGGRLLPRDRGEPGRGLDLPGLSILSTAVLLVVVPLVLGHEEHWPLWGWLALAAAAPLLALFVLVERRAVTPLAPGRVLRTPGLALGLITLFATMAAYGGFLFTMALHLQSGLGEGPLRAGLTFVPGGLCFAAASLNWRRLPARWHHRLVPAGLLVGTVSLALLAPAVYGDHRPGGLFFLSQALFGLGFGAAFSPLLTQALSRVPATDAADASGLLTTMTQLALVVGVATFGSLFLARVAGDLSGHALAVTSLGEAALTLIAAVCTLRLPRPPAR